MSTVTDDPKLQTPEPALGNVETATSAEPSTSAPPAPSLGAPDELRPPTREEIIRPAVGALMTTLACAFMVGGMFQGISPRIYAGIGAFVGVGMAVWAARANKRIILIQSLSLVFILLAGVVLLSFSDFGNLGKVSKLVGDAAKNARLRKPPIPFDEGWRAILPWTIGMIGFAATWVGSVGRKPAVGLLVPIPVIAFAAIAQPDSAEIASGIIAFVAFAIGLAIIYRADRGEGDGVSTAYELKRAAKTAPLVVVLIAALIGASQLNLLFPQPLIDPTQKAKKPTAVRLKDVKDRVLFTVKTDVITGPWRIGILDVYDGKDWLLPPFGNEEYPDAPLSGLLGGVFRQEVRAQTSAEFTVRGLEGTVVPLPARMNGIVGTNLPKLVVDPRAQGVRVKEGQVTDGLKYTAAFAFIPSEADIEAAGPADPDIVAQFTDTKDQAPPPAVVELLAKAPQNKWKRLEYVRKQFLDVFESQGAGLPTSVPASRVQDMLAGSHTGTPFEFVAAQALLARWAGVPARIGFGFDRGKKEGGVYEYRPKSGSSWLEVYFEGYGWFPITGLPKKAKQSTDPSEITQNAQILPSDDIDVSLFIPSRVPPKGALVKQIVAVILITLPFLLAGFLFWLFRPAYLKNRRRARRRAWAAHEGRAARVAVAYADLRETATDLGVGDPYVTPLAYVNKVVPDEEHRELAWLVTRCLWGDLKNDVTDDEVFAAEELSRSIRRRLFEAQPFTIRGISIVSRLSLRNPYAPELLSPPLEKFSMKRSLARVFRRGPKKVKETIDEAIEVA